MVQNPMVAVRATLILLTAVMFTEPAFGQARTLQPKVLEPKPLPQIVAPVAPPILPAGIPAGAVVVPNNTPSSAAGLPLSPLEQIQYLESKLNFSNPIGPHTRPQNVDIVRNVNRQVRLMNCYSPNIVLFVLNDVGIGDLGAYGQEKIRTPNIDNLAANGIRFDQFYSGSALGTPSRASLMLGLHTGHMSIRGEGPNDILKPGDVTLPEVLWQGGYTTAGIGEWDVGNANSSSSPNNQGFDYWYGFMNTQEAADPYPDFVWINTERVPIPENNGGQEKQYANDILTDAAVAYLIEYRKRPVRPFFLYLPLTLPGNTTKVPNDAPYSHEEWTQEQKNQAAILTRADDTVGRIVDALRRLGLAGNTAIFLTSDNGPSPGNARDIAFFNSTRGLRGAAGDLHEGNIRVPMIVSFPRHTSLRGTDNVPRAHWDVFPTIADLTNTLMRPTRLDGISMFTIPTSEKPVHEYLYWQIDGDRPTKALRWEDWKAITTAEQDMELYQLARDSVEKENLVVQQPEIAAKLQGLMQNAQMPLMPKPAVPPQVRTSMLPR